MENPTEIQEGKTPAIVAYITIIGAVIAIFINENKITFSSFHIRQALGIHITYFALGYFIGYFDSWMITSAYWTFIFILWLFGFLGAINGEYKIVPLVGEWYQKIFKGI
jgi:uncharacterized membrane protein